MGELSFYLGMLTMWVIWVMAILFDYVVDRYYQHKSFKECISDTIKE